MRRVEAASGLFIRVADDATDEDVARLLAPHGGPARTKVRAPAEAETKTPTKKAARPRKAAAKKAKG